MVRFRQNEEVGITLAAHSVPDCSGEMQEEIPANERRVLTKKVRAFHSLAIKSRRASSIETAARIDFCCRAVGASVSNQLQSV